MSRRSLLVACTLAPAWSTAAAQPTATLELHWQAPAGCPGARQLETRLREHWDDETLRVRGSVTLENSEYLLEAEITTPAQHSVRRLRAPDCEALARSLVWFVELSRTNTAPAAPPHTASTPDEELPPTVLTAPAAPASASTRSRGEQRAPAEDVTPPTAAGGVPSSAALSGSWSAGVSAELLNLGFGALAPALSASASLATTQLSGELRAGAVFHPQREVSDTAAIAVRTFSATLMGCKEWGERAYVSWPCLALSGMHTSAHGRGLEAAQPRSRFWAALGIAARAQLWLSEDVRITLEAGILFPVTPRPSFEVERVAAQAGQILAFGRLGAALRLP